MISILFCSIYVVYSQTYVLNPNEVKVFDSYAEGMEKYDLQNSKFVPTCELSFDEDVTVKSVASQFMPFDALQRVNILTINSNDQYVVYTITYDKLLRKDCKITNSVLQDVTACTSIAYLGDQYVVDCSDTSLNFVLQNGTTVTYKAPFKFSSIQSYYGGIAGVSTNQLIIFNENLEIETHYDLDFISILITYESVYILQTQQISVYMKDDSPQVFQHNCKQAPQFMTVIDNNFYVQCETLKIILQGYIQEIPDLPDTITSLSATANYLIINNQQIYDRFISNLYYTSESAIYPINYDDNAMKLTNKNIIIGKIVGLYLITEEKPQTFEIFDYQFQVVDWGLQALNTTKSQKYQTYYVYEYVAGPDVKVVENGKNVQPLHYDLLNSFLEKTLYDAFIYKISKIVLLYSQNSFLNASICDIIISGQVVPKCEPPKIIKTNFPQDASNIKGIYDSTTDQTVVCYQSLNSLSVHIQSETDLTFENVVNYDLSEEMLVILYKDKVSINYLWSSEYREYVQIEIVASLVTIHKSQVFLLDSQNNFIILTDSINGWFRSYQKPILDKVLKLSYVYDQLFIITDKVIFVYQNSILRGAMKLDMTGNKQYFETQTHFYIYNSTHIYQYQAHKELSFSSLLQSVILHENSSQFIALSYQQYELIIRDNQLFVYDQVSTFKPKTVVESDIYSRFSTINVTFNNSFHQKVSQTVKIIGDTLKLSDLRSQNSKEDLKFDDNKTLSLFQTEFFSGPISSMEIDNGKSSSYSITQRVSSLNEQPKWTTTLTDVIDIGNATVIYNVSTLLLCNQNNCSVIQEKTPLCTSLEQDQTSFYLICQKQVYQATKKSPKELHANQFIPDKNPLIWRFLNQSMMAIMYNNGSSINITLYQNYQIKTSKLINDLKDFQFNDTNIVLLTYNQVIIVDFSLETIHTYDLLKDLATQGANPALNHAKFQTILRVTSDQYIISSYNAPTFQIYLHPDSIELVFQFTNIPNSIPLDAVRLETKILIVTYKVGAKIYAAFYDQSEKSKSSLIIPYFNVIQLGGYISQNHYVREYDNNQVVITTQNGAKTAYQINKNVIIKAFTNSKQISSLNAYDLDIQSATFKAYLDAEGETNDNEKNWIIAAYVIAGLIGLALLLIGLRYLRRFCLVRRLKFVEEKGSEFKSEYI